MKRATLLSILGLAISVALVVLVRMRQKPAQQQPPAVSSTPEVPTNALTSTNAPTIATQPVPPPAPAEQLPSGWQDFRVLSEHQQLNREGG
jgi:ABC-type antimicrobial peptide transport system permease subunit